MGTSIAYHVEMRRDGRWEYVGEEGLGDGNYGLYGFLADVRNYSHSPVIAGPRGLPDDVDMDQDARKIAGDGVCASWLLLSELLTYDYEQVFWDRRITREVSPGHFNGAALAEEGEGEHVSMREFLGSYYFDRLDALARAWPAADVRIVFWFNS